MEIQLDIGQNTLTKLTNLAEKNEAKLEDFAVEMMELGVRISSAPSSEEAPKISEEMLVLIENNRLLKEVIRCVFDRDKTSQKVFNVDTLLQVIDEYIEGYKQAIT